MMTSDASGILCANIKDQYQLCINVMQHVHLLTIDWWEQGKFLQKARWRAC